MNNKNEGKAQKATRIVKEFMKSDRELDLTEEQKNQLKKCKESTREFIEQHFDIEFDYE